MRSEKRRVRGAERPRYPTFAQSRAPGAWLRIIGAVAIGTSALACEALDLPFGGSTNGAPIYDAGTPDASVDAGPPDASLEESLPDGGESPGGVVAPEDGGN